MESNNPQKQAARNLFLHTDRTRAEIADLIDINTKTLYLWIKHGRWEEMKTAARQTPASLLQDVYDHIEAINNKIKAREDRCPTYQEVEMLRKLFASTKHINKLNLGSYVQSFTELTSFINDHDHELGKKIVILTDKYIKGLVKPHRAEPFLNVSDVKDNLELIKAEEEKDLAELQKAETFPVQEQTKTENDTAIIIPLPVNHETLSTNNTSVRVDFTPGKDTETQSNPAPIRSIMKGTPSRFTRPPLLHRYLSRIILGGGNHRVFFHIVGNPIPNNNINSMPDKNW